MTQEFSSVLIANRGEIAVRVIRSVQAQGLRAIAVYSDADATAPHVLLADDAVRIGAGPVGDSYLDPARILEAAGASGAGAIHPGYGFLSENAAFARAVEAAGMVFVGPTPEAIEVMGDKAAAKRVMIAAGVPCVPGYEGGNQSDASLIGEAAKIGFPVMVKASAGGGGRGMRLVERDADLPDALMRARDEALNAFGSDHLILEKAVQHPRHVEFQIFADAHGNIIHLGERDCSVQRRHQKVIEEAPCPVMSDELRQSMGDAAIAAARTVHYRGAGTVEFLLDAQGGFFFLEMNTRLQVEHPVTEMVTGLDLVALQLSVAAGEVLPLSQSDVRLNGHAIEVRLYAEDPAADFLPVTGKIALWRPASGDGVRVDEGVSCGQEVSPFYDPMLAKIIAWGPSRDVALRRLIAAVRGSVLLGVETNTAFLAELLTQPGFAAAKANTGFIAETYPDGITRKAADTKVFAAASVLALTADSNHLFGQSAMPDDSLAGFSSAAALAARLSLMDGENVVEIAATAYGRGRWKVVGDGWTHAVDLQANDGVDATLAIDGQRHVTTFQAEPEGDVMLAWGAQRFTFCRHRPWLATQESAGSGQVLAPMPGQVISVTVSVGDKVTKGAPLAVLEAMKMQHQMSAGVTGTVRQVLVAPGQQLAAGTMMIEIEENDT